jgi:hypothetical protein
MLVWTRLLLPALMPVLVLVRARLLLPVLVRLWPGFPSLYVPLPVPEQEQEWLNLMFLMFLMSLVSLALL